jgi:hypothetical protein
MTQPTTDVIAIGNAIVDVMAPCDDALIETLGLSRGGMTLIDAEQAKQFYAAMGPAREISVVRRPTRWPAWPSLARSAPSSARSPMTSWVRFLPMTSAPAASALPPPCAKATRPRPAA